MKWGVSIIRLEGARADQFSRVLKLISAVPQMPARFVWISPAHPTFTLLHLGPTHNTRLMCWQARECRSLNKFSYLRLAARTGFAEDRSFVALSTDLHGNANCNTGQQILKFRFEAGHT